MPGECKKCGAEVEATEAEFDRGFASCEECHALNEIYWDLGDGHVPRGTSSDGGSSAAATVRAGPSPTEGRLEGDTSFDFEGADRLRVEEANGRLGLFWSTRMLWRLGSIFRWVSLFLVSLVAIWGLWALAPAMTTSGPIVLGDGKASPFEALIWDMATTATYAVVAAGLYGALRALLNDAYVQVSVDGPARQVDAGWGPLPWWDDSTSVSADRIEQIFVQSDVMTWGGGGRHSSPNLTQLFKLTAILDDETVDLVGKFEEPEPAVAFERLVEDYLGIRDRAVDKGREPQSLVEGPLVVECGDCGRATEVPADDDGEFVECADCGTMLQVEDAVAADTASVETDPPGGESRPSDWSAPDEPLEDTWTASDESGAGSSGAAGTGSDGTRSAPGSTAASQEADSHSSTGGGSGTASPSRAAESEPESGDAVGGEIGESALHDVEMADTLEIREKTQERLHFTHGDPLWKRGLKTGWYAFLAAGSLFIVWPIVRLLFGCFAGDLGSDGAVSFWTFDPFNAVGLTLVGAWLTYLLLGVLLTRRHVTVDATAAEPQLEIRFAPLAWFTEPQRFPVDRIDQLYVDKQASREFKSKQIAETYDVNVILDDGTEETIAAGLDEPHEATGLESVIEDYLGIHDRDVEGEYAGS
ncbi:MAG: hypothetical protein ABEL76_02845 [Bradymonadaceae bacterium]